MLNFDWNEEKNRRLKEDRGVCFEDVVTAIHENRILDIEKLRSSSHKGQIAYIVEIENYAYVVPFVINEDKEFIFLKTIYPSRKRTKKFFRY